MFAWQIEEGMPAEEFMDWMHLRSIRPWGEWLQDINTALIRESSLLPHLNSPPPASELLVKWDELCAEPMTEEVRQSTWEASVRTFIATMRARAGKK